MQVGESKGARSQINQPIFHHGDIVEVYRPGNVTVIGRVWWRSYGNDPSGIVPTYGILPLGEYSAKAQVVAAQDNVKLSQVYYN